MTRERAEELTVLEADLEVRDELDFTDVAEQRDEDWLLTFGPDDLRRERLEAARDHAETDATVSQLWNER